MPRSASGKSKRRLSINWAMAATGRGKREQADSHTGDRGNSPGRSGLAGVSAQVSPDRTRFRITSIETLRDRQKWTKGKIKIRIQSRWGIPRANARPPSHSFARFSIQTGEQMRRWREEKRTWIKAVLLIAWPWGGAHRIISVGWSLPCFDDKA